MKTQFNSFLIYDDLDIENFFSELVVENPNKKAKSTTVQLFPGTGKSLSEAAIYATNNPQ